MEPTHTRKPTQVVKKPTHAGGGSIPRVQTLDNQMETDAPCHLSNEQLLSALHLLNYSVLDLKIYPYATLKCVPRPIRRSWVELTLHVH